MSAKPLNLTEPERAVLAEVLDRCLGGFTERDLREQFDDWSEVDFAALDSLRGKVGA